MDTLYPGRRTPPKIKSRKATTSPELVPVKVTGQSHQLYMLQQLISHKRGTRKRASLSGLGDILVPWYQKNVDQPGQKLAGIIELWAELVPERLATQTRLVGFVRGTLSVAVDHATARTELDYLLRQSLLRQLQTGSKGTIFRVKTSIDGSTEKGHD